jgi:hypothetical protein
LQSDALFLRPVSLPFNYEDIRWPWSHQRQIIGSDLLNACVRSPGTLFYLQLAPFDIQLVTIVCQSLEFDE